MLDLNNTTHILIIVLSCLFFTLGVIFYVKRIAKHIGAMDIPNERKVHKIPIPRLGGLGIFLGFLFGYILFGEQSIQMNSILIGSFIIILFGVMDDISPLGAKTKFLGQILAACIVVFYGNITIGNATIFGLVLNFGWWSYLITILFIVGCINIINLIDGLDGLSGGTCAIFYATIGIIAFMQGSINALGMTLTFIMFGCTLGFLYHNFYPAKIFAGDSGSMFQGFMIAVISLLGFKTTAMISLFVPVCILGIPILDTLFAIIRRLIKKQPIYLPDKCHLHHQLLDLGLSHRNTVLAIYAMNILFAAASIIYILKDKKVGVVIYLIIFILLVWIVTRTSIIADKKHPKNYDKKTKATNKNK